MKILYIVLNDLGKKDSGSGLRPNCMLQAFQDRDHELYVLSGAQDIQNAAARKAAVQETMVWLQDNTPDLCYIESSTYPIMLHCDYALIRYLKKKKIPMGYFYRDIYRVIPGVVQKARTGLVNRAKDLFLRLLQNYTDLFLRKLDIIYFPSQRFTDYFSYKRMELLPPAGEVKFLPEHPNHKTCIYVGGVSEFYGYPLMMEAFRLLNKDEIRYRLILVCREAEYQKMYGGEEIPAWLEVHHASGKDLEPLYARADAGLLALGYNEYSHLCIGIKLFQYLSYGLPVISTNVATMGQIIRENGFGVLAEPNAESYAAAIRAMLDDDDKLKAFRPVIRDSLQNKHLWVHRVDKIVQDLAGEHV